MFLADEKDNKCYDWSFQSGQNKKISAQGQHRILRTGYPGQDNRTAHLGQDVQLKTLREIIILFTKT